MARPFIAIAFILQRLADVIVIYATSQPTGLDLLLRGLAIGSLVWTTALTVGVWRHLRWARYVLTTYGWIYVFVLAFAPLRHWQEYSFESIDPRSLPLVSAALYLAATAILVRSRRLRHFTNR